MTALKVGHRTELGQLINQVFAGLTRPGLAALAPTISYRGAGRSITTLRLLLQIIMCIGRSLDLDFRLVIQAYR